MLKPFEVFGGVFVTLVCIDRIVYNATAVFEIWSMVVGVFFILFTSGYWAYFAYVVQRRKQTNSNEKEKN